MTFWEGGGIVTFLLIGMLLALAGLVRRVVPQWAALGVPSCILAGLLGLLLGPGVAGVLPLDFSVLEGVVYHGLALTFIALGLQTPPANASTPDAYAMGLGISVMAVVQGIAGFLVVIASGLFAATTLHPGIGLLLPLGYNQGPGQALSMGTAWEASGLVDGGQIGLIIAAAGFGWAIFAGIPLVAYGRRKGWFKDPGEQQDDVEQSTDTALADEGPGALEPLTTHLVTIGVIYLLTLGVLLALTALIGERPKLVAMIWGFHFLIALGITLLVRRLWPALPTPPLSNDTLSRFANLIVDLVTCSALAAIQVAVFGAHWLPIVLITLFGVLVTFVGVIWLSSRGFRADRFHHAVLLFGSSTGTLPMGLALLRLIDPKLRSAAPASATQGAVFALIFSAPLLLLVMPYPIAQWPEGHPMASYITLGIFVVYFFALIAFWRLAGLSFRGGVTLWAPPEDE